MTITAARDGLRRMTAGLPPAFWYLWGGTLVNRLGTFVVPFLTLYLTEARGVPLGRAALVVSLFGAGAFAANLAGGYLADRIGRRRTMVLGLGMGAVMMVVLGFARAFPLIAAATLLLGFFADLYRPAVQAAIADLVPPPDRVRAFALMYWSINLGTAVAPLVAGFLASRAFLALFLLDAATSVAYLLLILARVPETRPPEGQEAAPGLRARAAAVAADPHLLRFTALGLVMACIFHQGFVTLPIDMRGSGLTSEAYGVAISINGFLIVLFSVPVGHLAARFARLRVMAAGALLVGAGFGLTALAGSLPAYAASVAVWTAGELLVLPLAPAVVSELAPVRLRGVYQGVYGASWGLASLLGPALGGTLFARAGPAVLWPACAVLGLLAAAGYLALAGSVHRRTTAVAP